MGRTKKNTSPRRPAPGVPRWLSLRSLVLLLVLAFAVVLVLPTLRQQLAHEQQLGALRDQVARAKQREDDLNAELQRWEDPAYVQSQARTRLGYVLPGETAYRVLDPQAVPATSPSPAAEGAADQASPVPSELPWYLKLAGSWPGAQPTGSPTPAASSAP